MTDPVTASVLLITTAVTVIAPILKLIESEIRRNTTSCCKEALSALKDTITRIQPILNDKRRLAMKKRRDKDSAVDDWFEKLAAYLNKASRLVEQTKLLTRFDRQIKTQITNLTEDIDKHLKSDNLVRMVQNEEILEGQQKIREGNLARIVQNEKILEGQQKIREGNLARIVQNEKILEVQQKILEALASSSRFADTVKTVHTLTGIMHSKQIREPLASSSRFADTAKAADTPIGIMNSKKEDKPVTGNLSTVSSFQDQDVDFHLSRHRPPRHESTLRRMTSYRVARIGRVLYDYAAVCDDELNLTAREEVQIISEEEGWFCGTGG